LASARAPASSIPCLSPLPPFAPVKCLLSAGFPLLWVAQATRLCRSATRRPERQTTACCQLLPFCNSSLPLLPPGQWPGGTGGSPVLPIHYEICGLAVGTRPQWYGPRSISHR
jgi:hypothetical protein